MKSALHGTALQSPYYHHERLQIGSYRTCLQTLCRVLCNCGPAPLTPVFCLLLCFMCFSPPIPTVPVHPCDRGSPGSVLGFDVDVACVSSCGHCTTHFPRLDLLATQAKHCCSRCISECSSQGGFATGTGYSSFRCFLTFIPEQACVRVGKVSGEWTISTGTLPGRQGFTGVGAHFLEPLRQSCLVDLPKALKTRGNMCHLEHMPTLSLLFTHGRALRCGLGAAHSSVVDRPSRKPSVLSHKHDF